MTNAECRKKGFCPHYSDECEKMLAKPCNNPKMEGERPLIISLQSSLCWCCRKSVRQECSWAKDFVPIKGWNAVKTIKNPDGLYPIESYNVKDCPEF